MQPSDTHTLTRTFAQADFDRFAALSGDDNPIHVDPSFATRSKFGRTAAHGMLLYGVVSAAVGQVLPGSRQVTQELMFPSPTFVGEEVTITLEMRARTEETADLDVQLHNGRDLGLQGSTRVQLEPGWQPIRGEALIFPPSEDEQLGRLELGQRAGVTRTFTREDIAEYRDLTGDPALPGDDAELRVPGPLIGGMFSKLLGTDLPGRGTNYLKQSLHFREAAFTGQALTASVTVVRLRAAKHLVDLHTVCTIEGGALACEGRALVQVSDLV